VIRLVFDAGALIGIERGSAATLRATKIAQAASTNGPGHNTFVTRLKDPGGIFRHRALRIAVVLPITFFFVQEVLQLKYGSGIACFTSYALLALADFGGPRKSRAKAYVITGLVGLPLIVLGSLLSGYLVISILSAGLVAFLVNYAGVLRGYFASAGVALLLPFVMAVTSPPGVEVMWQLCVGYAIGVVVSLVAALTLWPTYLESKLRVATATALTAVADEVSARWLGGISREESDEARVRTASAIAAMHSLYDGALGRPGPGTARDRSLIAVISELDRVDSILQWQVNDLVEFDDLNAELANITVTTFMQASQAFLGSGSTPDASKLNLARERHQLKIEQRAEDLLKRESAQTHSSLRQLNALMPLRIVALSAQSIAGNVVGAIGNELPEGSAAVTLGGQQLWDPVERQGASHYLSSQFAWRSPWVRNAIRASAAIVLATAVVQITDIPHGMWIVLGTLVALKFDAAGTSRTAASVLVGTIFGFVLASGVIYAVGTNDIILWILLPFAVFLAAYTPNSISLLVGQGAFTVYGVVLYALILPTGFTTAEYRLFDVFLAMIVSLLVSALLWPRGVVPLVDSTLQSAAVKAGTYLVNAIATLTHAVGTRMPEDLAGDGADSRRALTVARQSYDLAYAQKGPGLPDIERWSYKADAVSNVGRTAEIVSSVVHHGRTSGGDPASRAALVDTARCIDRSLGGILAEANSGANFADNTAANLVAHSAAPTAAPSDLAPEALKLVVEQMRTAVTSYAASQFAEPHKADAKDLTSILWIADWLQYAAWEVEQQPSLVHPNLARISQ